MAAARPELIFLRGPQEGERAVLMTNTVVIGRGAAADVRLKESAASREQLRFELSVEGWLMENLSANGTIVNGKRYKKKKLLLDTGDVLSVGAETEILYVAPGDDPETALAAYREANPVLQPVPTAEGKPPEKTRAAAAGPKAGGREEPAEEAAEDEVEETSRLKYILGGVVLFGLVGFGAVLLMRPAGNGPDGPGGLPRLSDERIIAVLAAPLERSPDPGEAAKMLNQAITSWAGKDRWDVEEGDLFRCVKSFKLHQAYRQSRSFANPKHESIAEDVQKELTDEVVKRYRESWKFEQAHQWQNASRSFKKILQIIPPGEIESGGPIDRVLIKNVIAHINYIKKNMGRVPG